MIDRSLKTLQGDLKLTDSQVSRIRQLAESRRGRLESARREAMPKFEELTRLLNRPNPDPTAVGNAAIAFKQAHDQAMAEQSNIERDFLSVLNDSQRQTVERLKSEMPAVTALRRLGLVTRPESNWGQQALTSENR
jgi:Spy/CpxP family protein refolding chaperone